MVSSSSTTVTRRRTFMGSPDSTADHVPGAAFVPPQSASKIHAAAIVLPHASRLLRPMPAAAGIGRDTKMRTSAIARLAVMGALLIALLVPLNMVQSVVSERAWRRNAVADEVGATWGSAQVIGGPVLMVPYR